MSDKNRGKAIPTKVITILALAWLYGWGGVSTYGWMRSGRDTGGLKAAIIATTWPLSIPKATARAVAILWSGRV